MSDIEIAKKHLYENELTLAIAKNGQVIFQTDSHRISGFIHAINTLGVQLDGASVADRVAGKALALLCVYSGISEVYAEVLSKKAQTLFEEYKVDFQWETIVDNILDVSRANVCPFEKMAESISDPSDSYAKFKDLLEKMKSCK